FGCRVIAFDPYCSASDLGKVGFLKAELDEIYKKADIISFHAPLTPETTHIFSKKDLPLLKRGVYIVNTARGGLVETKALLEGVQNGLIAGVGLDVLENEEDIMEEAEGWHGRKLERASLEIALQNHMLINDPRVIITPHNAFNSREALERIMQVTANNILGSL
ncbi:MAG: NAD(P)-dependent oxidoreductase, partial [bacterium]